MVGDDVYVEPWWGPRDPDFLVFINEAISSPSETELLVELGGGVRTDLEVQSNLPTLAVADVGMKPEAPLPESIYGVLTNDPEVESWASGRDIPVLFCSVEAERISLRDEAAERSFSETETSNAVRYAAERLEAISYGPTADEFFLRHAEHRQLEVVIGVALDLTIHSSLDPEDRALLQAAADTIRAQMATSSPDRTIIGRSLHRISVVAGVLVVGVAANYLTDLLRRFGVPWP